jgi:hypothetical protein
MTDVPYSLELETRYLHDGSEETAFRVDALAASGDCFVTIATELDAATHETLPESVRLKLEDIIRTLLYLQRNYAVVKKQSDYRQ